MSCLNCPQELKLEFKCFLCLFKFEIELNSFQEIVKADVNLITKDQVPLGVVNILNTSKETDVLVWQKHQETMETASNLQNLIM